MIEESNKGGLGNREYFAVALLYLVSLNMGLAGWSQIARTSFLFSDFAILCWNSLSMSIAFVEDPLAWFSIYQSHCEKNCTTRKMFSCSSYAPNNMVLPVRES